MVTTSRPVKPMPRPDVPFLLPNGQINPDWYEWLLFLADTVKQLREEV